MTHSAPALSVYTISFAHAGHCLDVVRDLRRQTIAAQLELIVVAVSADGLAAEELAAFHSHQVVLVSEIPNIGIAMAAAVYAAHAPFVVYAEEHATFEPTWATALVAAHERGYPVVGFTMRNANPETLTSWAHLYGQFGPVVDPVETAEMRLLGGHHVSYSRTVLLSYGDTLNAMLEDEGALFLDLPRRGHTLLLDGAAVSYHINLSSVVEYIRLDFNGQRGFGAARATTGHFPLWKRLAYALACPLVPCVRLGRILFHLQRTKRFGQLMPGILLPIIPALVAGAVGEALGYVVGAGASAENKIGPELRRREFLAAHDPSGRAPTEAAP